MDQVFVVGREYRLDVAMPHRVSAIWQRMCVKKSLVRLGVLDLGPRWGRLDPNGTNPGVFSDQISV